MNESDYYLDRSKLFKSLTISIEEILEDSVEDKTIQRILLDRISLKVLDLLSDLKPSNSAKPIVSDSEVAHRGVRAIYKSETRYPYMVYLLGVCDSITKPQAYYVGKFRQICHDDIDRFEILGVPTLSDH